MYALVNVYNFTILWHRWIFIEVQEKFNFYRVLHIVDTVRRCRTVNMKPDYVNIFLP